MAKPKPIKARMIGGKLEINVIGFRDKTVGPYLSISTDLGGAGYIEDKDIKRLRAWCDDCLKKRKS